MDLLSCYNPADPELKEELPMVSDIKELTMLLLLNLTLGTIKTTTILTLLNLDIFQFLVEKELLMLMKPTPSLGTIILSISTALRWKVIDLIPSLKSVI